MNGGRRLAKREAMTDAVTTFVLEAAAPSR